MLARESPAAGDGRHAGRLAGHALTFDDVGDPAGAPVLYFHGGGDSRLSRHPDDSIAASLGVRLVAVDRCGPSVKGRTLVRWAREVEELADGLGLERFAVLGWSAGGPHALAVAAVLPERVTRAALVGSMPPPQDVRLLPVDVQRTMRLARLSPWLAAKALERWGRRPPPGTGDAETDRAYALGRAESFRAGGMWLARELAALGRPWGFDPADVQAHVDLWWGDRDRVCPPAIGEDFAQVLPHATLHLVDGTHQLLFQRWRDILAALATPVVPRERLEIVRAAIAPEGAVEERLVADDEWLAGAAWGEPRPGHPEGIVATHIADVLRNVDALALDADDRRRLRLVALVHDTFKHAVDRARPRTGENHHATIARRFAERFTDDVELLEVVELHDEAFNAWSKGSRDGNWAGAEQRAQRLIARLGDSLAFYLRFYRADNDTGSKSQEPLRWFEDMAGRPRDARVD